MPDIDKPVIPPSYTPQSRRQLLSSAAKNLFAQITIIPARISAYISAIIADLRHWPQRKSNDRQRIADITIAATVAPDEVKKALLHAARIRSGVLWLAVLINIYLLSIIGSAFSWVHVTNVIALSIALVVNICLAIESCRKATESLLRFIAEDDPDDVTHIAPGTFIVSPAMILSPWIKNKNGLINRVWISVRKRLLHYFGMTK